MYHSNPIFQIESPLKGDVQQAHANSSGLRGLYLPNRIQNRLTDSSYSLTHFGSKPVLCFSLVHSVHFISVSVLAAEQTVTDGSALSSEETSRANGEALNAASAQLCCTQLCASSQECLHSRSLCCCSYIKEYIQQLNQKDETVNMCIRPPGVRLSCTHLHLYRFLSLDPSFLVPVAVNKEIIICCLSASGVCLCVQTSSNILLIGYKSQLTDVEEQNLNTAAEPDEQQGGEVKSGADGALDTGIRGRGEKMHRA